ncbi:MAG TPA: hypothetical protein VNF28_02405 [Candidatus Binataceae bacterium]|nr:hypothetical protein [Candidatus Binataceae bacterium]
MTIVAITVAVSLLIGTGRAYAQSGAASADAQIAPGPGAQPGIGDREVEQAAATLEQLARSNFGHLDDAELKLVHAAPQRALMWAGTNNDASSSVNDPSNASDWPPARTIRAELIRWLVADPQARPFVHPSGIGIGGAKIGGELDLSYLTLNAPLTIINSAIPDGIDFSFAHLQGLDLSRDVTGPLTGDRATITGDVQLTGGKYGPVSGDRVTIAGDLLLTGGDFGPVSLFRAEIGGSLDCSGGRFVGGADPLSIVEATIRGDASFNNGFTTNGVVDLTLAQIGRGLSFKDAHFIGTGVNGLNADRATIDGTFYWDSIVPTPGTELNLTDARTASLWDDAASWPATGNLFIDDFVYGDISGGPSDAQSRLRWLARQPSGYRPQPYGQLAKVMRERGSDIGAVDVMMAKEDARRDQSGLGWSARLWSSVLDVTIGYGYRPMRALWWIFSFVALGSMLFGWGYRERAITPTEPAAYEAFVQSGEPPRHYPPFNAVVYSLENFLPVVDLHQGTYWRPNPRHGAGGRVRALSGTLLRWYLWVHILAGWIITPLLAAGLSGLVRPD